MCPGEPPHARQRTPVGGVGLHGPQGWGCSELPSRALVRCCPALGTPLLPLGLNRHVPHPLLVPVSAYCEFCLTLASKHSTNPSSSLT